MADTEQKSKGPVRVVVLVIIILLLAGGYFYYKKVMPKQLMNLGKKNYEIGQYDKALSIFRYLSSKNPHDTQPVYYEVLTLSKMPPSYKNQQKIYEISQYEDLDEAAALADEVLSELRSQLDKQAGANYIDNVLFEDSLVRWANPSNLTYAVKPEAPVPPEFSKTADRAFKEWQSVSNGEFAFKRVNNNADINIHIVYSLPVNKVYLQKNASAVTIPDITGTKLNKMDIYLKSADIRVNYSPDDKLYGLMLHEIGHALGLGGHSVLPEDVMYYDGDKISPDTMPKSISNRDLNTLNYLYKMLPNVIDTELSDSEKNLLIYPDIITSYPGENFEIETQRLMQELKTDARNLPRWVDLSINFGMRKQYARANYILERIIPLAAYDAKNQAVIYYNMALNYYRLKDYQAASRYLVLAEDINKDKDTQKLNAFIAVKEAMQASSPKTRDAKLALAKRHLKELQVEYPADVDIAVKLAEIYYQEDRPKEARQVIEELIKENPAALRDRRAVKYRVL